MRDHRKLRAFVLADDLAIAIYKETRGFPRDELFGLTGQMRRAAVSVCANIVEGCAREGHAEYVNFLNIAFGSLRELGYYIDLARRLEYMPAERAVTLTAGYDQAAGILAALLKALVSRKPTGVTRHQRRSQA